MCDTFIALPPATRDGSVIFAKNSDRPYQFQINEFGTRRKNRRNQDDCRQEGSHRSFKRLAADAVKGYPKDRWDKSL